VIRARDLESSWTLADRSRRNLTRSRCSQETGGRRLENKTRQVRIKEESLRDNHPRVTPTDDSSGADRVTQRSYVRAGSAIGESRDLRTTYPLAAKQHLRGGKGPLSHKIADQLEPRGEAGVITERNALAREGSRIPGEIVEGFSCAQAHRYSG